MAVSVNIRLDKRATDTLLSNLGNPRLRARAQNNAINRTITMANTQVRREVKEEMQLKNLQPLRNQLRLTRSRPATLAAVLKGMGEPIPYSKMKGVRASRSGSIVTSRRSDGDKRHERAFKKRLSTGHLGYFQRLNERTRRFRELKGPGIGWAMEKDKVVQAFQKVVDQRYIQRLRHEVGRLMRRR